VGPAGTAPEPSNTDPHETSIDLAGRFLLAGFVDMHTHGGGGAAFSSGDVEQAVRAAAFHRVHGTTTTVASTVSTELEDLQRYLSDLAGLVEHLTHSSARLMYLIPTYQNPVGGVLGHEGDQALARSRHVPEQTRILGPGEGQGVVEGHALSQGAIVAHGRCYEGGAPAFGIWQDLLIELAASAALDPAGLPQPFGGAPPVQTAHHLMQSVVGALWSAAAPLGSPRGSPEGYPVLVLLLDDMHWADRDSLALLDLATRRLDSVSILTIVTYRSEDVRRHHPLYDLLPSLQRDRPVERVRLRRLGRADTAVIVEARCGPCSPQLIDSLHARSEGNPFFLVELLRDFREWQVLDHAEQMPPSDQVPTVLQQVVVRRIGRLGMEVEQLLQAAAVAGEEWDLGTIEAVLGWQEERVLRALETALEAQVIAPSAEGAERYRFSHGLIREVLYTEQVARRRKHLHGRIAAALEETKPSGRGPSERQAAQTAALAHHYCAAEQWEKAMQYSMAAGDAARDRNASRTALQLYEQALDMLQWVSGVDPETQAALYDRLGQVRLILNHTAAARSAFEQMVRTAQAGGDGIAEGRALLWLSFVLTRLSHMNEAQTDGDAALEVARQAGDRRLLAAGTWNLGRLSAASGKLELASGHLDEAKRLAHGEGESTLVGRCLMEQARLSNYRGEYALAARQAAEALELAGAGRDSLFLAGICWTLGIAHGELGQYSQAREVLQQGLAYTGETDDLHYPVKLLNTLGWLHGEIGDTEAALFHDQQALDAARRGPADPIREAECYCLLNLATDRLQAGDTEAAERHLQEFEATDTGIEYSRFRYLNRYHLARAQLALAGHDPEGALRCTKGAEDGAAARGMRKNLAKSWMLRGQALMALKRPQEAARYLRRSVVLADELQHGSLRWQARLRLAQAHLLTRQTAAAGTAMQEARDLIEAIASDLWDERLRDAFWHSSLVREVYDAGHARPVAVYPAGLTAREVEVLRLVAQGATNKDVARALYISVKTVNAHLTSIFTKVDCRTRAAAAAFAFEHGLI